MSGSVQYLIIPAAVANDTRLGYGAKILFGRIYSLSVKRGYCYASNSTMAAEQGMSLPTFKRQLQELVDAGYVRTVSRGSKRQIFVNRERLKNEPLRGSEMSPIDERLKNEPLRGSEMSREGLKSEPHKIIKEKEIIKDPPLIPPMGPEVPAKPEPQPPKAPPSRQRVALENLWQWARGDWLKEEIAAGMAKLLMDGKHDGMPSADLVTVTANIYLEELTPYQLTPEERPRVKAAFEQARRSMTVWPRSKDICDFLPRRREQEQLPEATERGSPVALMAEFERMKKEHKQQTEGDTA